MLCIHHVLVTGLLARLVQTLQMSLVLAEPHVRYAL